MQDILVFWSMLMENAGMRQEPADALRTLQNTSTGVLVTDGWGRSVGDLFWADLLPEIEIVDSTPKGPAEAILNSKHPIQPVLNSISNPIWVRRLIVGSRGACLHWTHCVHPEIQGKV